MNTRRAFLQQIALAGAAGAFGLPRLANAADTGHESDWRWLEGNWDVKHERLRDRLVGSTTWDKFDGKSAFWHTLGGLGNIDDNLLHLPTGTYRAFSARTFDPATNNWSIWWLDGRMAGRLDPPVMGGFKQDEGEFFGNDVHKGTPVTVRFRWHETQSKRPWWDQSFSKDDRKTWETNWRNYFTRTSATASPIPPEGTTDAAADDWKFLVGKWNVKNRRLRPDGTWYEFPSTFNTWCVMGGLGHVGDNVFHNPAGTYRGMSLRAYDTSARVWRTWWVDGRTPSKIEDAQSGRFENGIGVFGGDDSRSTWSRVNASSPRWEQAILVNGKWETNWTADFERA